MASPVHCGSPPWLTSLCLRALPHPGQELRRVEGLLRDMSDTTLRLVASHKEQDAQIAVAQRERATLQSEADATRRRLARALDQASRSALALMRGEFSQAARTIGGYTGRPAPRLPFLTRLRCAEAPVSPTPPRRQGTDTARPGAPHRAFSSALPASQPAFVPRRRPWCRHVPCCRRRAAWSRAGTHSVR